MSINIFKKYRILLLAAIGFIATYCANPVSPTGGPRDKTPPVITEEVPVNYSTQFNLDRILVSFDEFVQLNDLNNQLIISPLMNEKPDINPKGKAIQIKFNEELKDHTTYTLFFGDAIVDFTEGNPIKGYAYVFSTGDQLDSLSVHGKVLNAFTKEPEADVFVMLYSLTNDSIPIDSLPLLVRPDYVAKTNEKGKFELNNLRDEPYKMFALKDGNRNYKYDSPTELIAFTDEFIEPYFVSKPKRLDIDTSLIADSLQVIDTIKAVEKPPVEEDTKAKVIYELLMFEQIDSTQRLIESKIVDDYHLQFILEFPCDSFDLYPADFYADSIWKLVESNTSNDTIDFYILPNCPDTVEMGFSADGIVLDTLDFIFNEETKNSKRDKQKLKRLNIGQNIKGGKIELNQKLFLDFSFPVKEYDFSNILWIEKEDTLSAPFKFQDSIGRKLILDKELTEEMDYKLIIPDSVFYSYHGHSNDSLELSFSCRDLEKYGKILMSVELGKPGQNWIIQLTDEKDKLIIQHFINENSNLVFDFLKPGKYMLKAIRDENKNDRWDTGNYIRKQQAENVIYYRSQVEVKANWDLEENWMLEIE